MRNGYSYSPAEVQAYTGVSTTTQRDRRRNSAFYFGKKASNGRWFFSASDLLGLAIAEIALRQLGSLLEAERAGNCCTGEVAKHIGIDVLERPEFLKILPRNVVGSDRHQHLGRGYDYCLFPKSAKPLFTDDPAMIHDLGVETALVLDLRRIAKALNPVLVQELKS